MIHLRIVVPAENAGSALDSDPGEFSFIVARAWRGAMAQLYERRRAQRPRPG